MFINSLQFYLKKLYFIVQRKDEFINGVKYDF